MITFSTPTSNIHTIFAPPNYRSHRVAINLIPEKIHELKLDHSFKQNGKRKKYYKFDLISQLYEYVDKYIISFYPHYDMTILELKESGNPPYHCSDAIYCVFEEDLGKLMKDTSIRTPL